MLNSLKDIEENKVVGSKILRDKDIPLNEDGSVNFHLFDMTREITPIVVDDDSDTISFTMMTKPAAEGGTGCQLTDLIEVALHQLRFLNKNFPCAENDATIGCLKNALFWQSKRTADRTERGVEGKNEK